jgi:aminoglycoside phosphotransferase (APT) family kinase protein
MQLDSLHIQNEIRTYIQLLNPNIFGVTKITSITLSPLSNGYQNVNFMFELNEHPDKKYVIRFHPDNQQGRDKTATEAQNMQLLHEASIPKILFIDKPDFINSSIMIMEFIDGESKDFNSLTLQQMKLLAKTIARVHTITNTHYSQTMGGPATQSGNYADYLRAMIEYSIQRYLAPLKQTTYQECSQLVQQAQSRIAVEMSKAARPFAGSLFSLLHTDIGAGNVLWAGQVVTLIDWEEITFGDPADEVSYIFMVNNLTSAHQDEFLSSYFAIKADESLTQRLIAYTFKSEQPRTKVRGFNATLSAAYLKLLVLDISFNTSFGNLTH